MQSHTSEDQGDIVLSFYGDDFTGSTDAMESLTINGLPTVLFLDVPSKETLNRFPYIKCIGVAGNSRVMSPEQMEQVLPSIFERLRNVGSDFVHYKVCSTFDSSNEIGNIATVMRISRDVFKAQPWVPVFVASPDLKRYTVFGNHYAAMGADVYRLDRHPVMSRHPITPMSEADLRFVLQKQGAGDVALINVVDLEQPVSELLKTLENRVSNNPEAVLFDALTKDHVEKVGELMAASRRPGEPLFVIGSSGVGHAISSVRRSCEADLPTDGKRPAHKKIKKVNQLLVVSGSCSPVTQKQLQWAMDHGFEGIHLSLREVMDSNRGEAATKRLVARASEILKCGKSLVIYTALGPDDPTIKENQQQMTGSGRLISDSSKILGSYLGGIARMVIQETGIERLVIAGGDTSSYATRQLGIYAMEMIASISPGAPLCRCYSEDTNIDGLELALKSGQFGGEDYFTKVLEM
ncbi:four-carbon acid sugar kinase family protein [Alicyclobacillus kakegawensis]|uniref:four-carbon acid sugar kinase family protein n=1 Tax=Alicyclobacillus kakegawensis TaxID=392012 RepID=UPI00082F2893|nr:four-carbon acid sugar kinase family protein [Alicyclobacillus kakegawensis]